jgi:hypothetical protein
MEIPEQTYDKLLPKGIGDRTIAGLLALLFGVFGLGVLPAVSDWVPTSFWERVAMVVVEHVFVSVVLSCAVVLVWSLFTPRWVERLVRRVLGHLVVTLLFVILLSVASVIIAIACL